METRVTDETLRRIRSKLSSADSKVQIETVWGYGYRLRSGGGGV
ncbi:MAG: winged helix-turn-helix domain-containing protein [Eubacteriales bacterium]|nr:winged helix-turn-helix domain-containing protein [Eubacteriales bacterium]